jgi:UrcA family protein
MSNSHRSTGRALIMLALPVLFLARPAEAIVSTAASRSVTVNYHDLNLNAAADVDALYARIRAAAATVCALPEDWQPGNLAQLAQLAERGKCIDHAVARAVRTVRNDKLSAYHWRQINAWKHRFGEAPIARGAVLPLDSATPSG